MGQGLGKLTIVAHNHEPFGFHIEAADMGEMMEAVGKEFVDGGAAIFIATGADESGGFVHDDRFDTKGLNAFARGADLVVRLDAVSGSQAEFTVDEDFALENEGIASTTGSHTGGSEEFVEADAFVGICRVVGHG